MWRGRVHAREGTFKFIHVKLLDEVESEPLAELGRESVLPGHQTQSAMVSHQAESVEVRAVLLNAGLGHLLPRFVLNGYERVEEVLNITGPDLDYLSITRQEFQRICGAARSLQANHKESGLEGTIPFQGDLLEPCGHFKDTASLQSALINRLKSSESNQSGSRKMLDTDSCSLVEDLSNTAPSLLDKVEASEFISPEEGKHFLSLKEEAKDFISLKEEAKEFISLTAEAKEYISLKEEAKDCISQKEEAKDFISLNKEAKDCISLTKEARDFISLTEEATDFISLTEEATDFISLTEKATDFISLTEEATDFISLTEEATGFISLEEKASELVKKYKSDWQDSFLYRHVRQSQLNTTIISIIRL